MAVQFGLLRPDMTPRPAYGPLRSGPMFMGARSLAASARWGRPCLRFRAKPDGQERDVLVAWAEKEIDWDGRGQTASAWQPPVNLDVQGVVDYLGRPAGKALPERLTSAPVFVFLPAGQAATLPLEPPPPSPPLEPAPSRPSCSNCLCRAVPPRASRTSRGPKATCIPSSRGNRWPPIHAYNFGTAGAKGRIRIERQPEGWEVQAIDRNGGRPRDRCRSRPGCACLRTPSAATAGSCFGPTVPTQGRSVLAFRVLAKEE